MTDQPTFTITLNEAMIISTAIGYLNGIHAALKYDDCDEEGIRASLVETANKLETITKRLFP